MTSESKSYLGQIKVGSKDNFTQIKSGSKIKLDLWPNIGTFCPKFITEKIFSNKLTKIRKLFLNVLVDQNDQKRHFLLHQDKLISGSI